MHSTRFDSWNDFTRQTVFRSRPAPPHLLSFPKLATKQKQKPDTDGASALTGATPLYSLSKQEKAGGTCMIGRDLDLRGHQVKSSAPTHLQSLWCTPGDRNDSFDRTRQKNLENWLAPAFPVLLLDARCTLTAPHMIESRELSWPYIRGFALQKESYPSLEREANQSANKLDWSQEYIGDIANVFLQLWTLNLCMSYINVVSCLALMHCLCEKKTSSSQKNIRFKMFIRTIKRYYEMTVDASYN